MIPDYIERSLHKIAVAQKMCNYKIEPSSMSNGLGFLGIINTVAITNTNTDTEQSETEQKLHLIYKIPPTNEIRRKLLKSSLVFGREIDMYTKVLPAFMQFQQEKGINTEDSFVAFPKLYAYEFDAKNDVYFLIMEDLRGKNFIQWPKNQTMPFDYVKYILMELGKFHAISFAMQDQRGREFAPFRQYNDVLSDLVFRGKANAYMTETIERVIGALENPRHKEIMQYFRQTYMERVDELLNGESSKEFAVIGHGDCWNNNIMFQLDQSGKSLKSICFLDWQLSRFGPPVLDLLYFIFTVTDKQFRQQHYHSLLEIYHNSLSQTIEKFGSDPEKLYTFDNLQSQLRKFGDFAVLFASMIIQVRVAKDEHFSDLDDFANSIDRDQHVNVIGEYDSKTQAEYTIQINDLFTDLDNYGYLGSLNSRLNKMQKY